ncbi:MAG: hypothetical protein IJ017_00010 [Oscillospiraceae bacterium]|nr:hypothetical protein [Oscillospiraceae bacterium]
MKILLMGFAKMKYMPYMHFYLNHIDTVEHDVHLLYWNRDGVTETQLDSVHCHEFIYVMDDDIPKLQKIRGFFEYRKYAQTLLKREKFDFIIIMHSLPGVLMSGYLTRNYHGKYIFDYRDFTYENFVPYKRVIHKLALAAHSVFISSEGFRTVLPSECNIKISHNIVPDAMQRRKNFEYRADKPLRVAFWGYIRHEQLNRTIIAKLSNDERFELHFYGREQDIALSLKKYAVESGAKNVVFHGAYDPGEQDVFAEETDMIHNIYSNTEAPSQVFAVTNKFYDGLVYRLPQICMSGSFMGQLVSDECLGIVCDPQAPSFNDELWDYYHSFDSNEFCKSCDRVLEKVLREYEEGRSVIIDAITSTQKTE